MTQIIHTKYADIDVQGDAYPSPVFNQLLNQVIGLIKLIVIGLVLTGTNPFPHLGMRTPNLWTSMVSRKMMTAMMTFFMANAIQTQLMSTGAFEIRFNGD